jgi:hypothetical protein
MQRRPLRRYVISLAIATLLAAGITGCSNAKAGQTVYKFQPKNYPEGVGLSKNLEVEETKTGFAFKALEKDSETAMIMDMSGRIERVFPDMPGSTNIHVKVNPDIGHTTLAGLRFSKACVISIRADGTVEVDQEGLEVDTESGAKCISQKVADLGAIVMVEVKGSAKESSPRN